MSDITLCTNTECPMSKCYRRASNWEGKEDPYWQSYAKFEYKIFDENFMGIAVAVICDHYYEREVYK